MRPTLEIKAALSGAASLNSISQASRSAMRLSVYKLACEVLRLHTSELQRTFIESQPDDIQPLLKAECRRIYNLRYK